MIRDQRREAVCKFIGPGGGVGRQGNGSKRHDGLGAERFIQSPLRAGEAGRHGGVGVDDGVDIFSGVIDGEMHPDLAGHSLRSRQLVSLKIYNHHISWFQQRLAAAGWCSQNTIRAAPDRKIAGAAWHEAKGVQPLAEPDKIAPKLVFGDVLIQGQGNSCLAFIATHLEANGEKLLRCIQRKDI